MRDLSQNKEAAVELGGKSGSGSEPQEEERVYEDVEDNVYAEIEPENGEIENENENAEIDDENGDYLLPVSSVVRKDDKLDDFLQQASAEQGQYENYDGSSCKTTTFRNEYEPLRK